MRPIAEFIMNTEKRKREKSPPPLHHVFAAHSIK
jgi:hypothetical protein